MNAKPTAAFAAIARGRHIVNSSGSPAPEINRYLADTLKRRWKRYRKMLKRCQRKASEEAVHDSRIETRRLLSLVELIGTFLPDRHLKKARRLLKQHLDTYNQLRDTQVQLLYVGRMLRIFPGIRKFHTALLKREGTCARSTRKEIKRVETDRLRRLVRDVAKKLNDQGGHSPGGTPGRAPVIRAIDTSFGRVLRLRHRIDPADSATLHRTRIAFKEFRYMVEALAPVLPGVREDQLQVMQEYQSRLGDIQDAEVLLSALGKFIEQGKVRSGSGERFRDELRRRREFLTQAYLDAADQLYDFWSLPGAAGQATARKRERLRR